MTKTNDSTACKISPHSINQNPHIKTFHKCSSMLPFNFQHDKINTMNKVDNISEERSTNGLSALSGTLLPFAKKLLGSKGFVEIDILTGWDKIVGKDLSQFSFPQKIDFKRGEKNNGVLHLQVPSGAFALEIAHREKYILEKINAYFGYNAVNGLKIVQNSAISLPEEMPETEEKQPDLLTDDEKKYIESMAEDIKSSKLKEILIKLGQAIFNNNHHKEK